MNSPTNFPISAIAATAVFVLSLAAATATTTDVILAVKKIKANTPTPIWKRTALVTFTVRQCSAEILEVAQFFS